MRSVGHELADGEVRKKERNENMKHIWMSELWKTISYNKPAQWLGSFSISAFMHSHIQMMCELPGCRGWGVGWGGRLLLDVGLVWEVAIIYFVCSFRLHLKEKPKIIFRQFSLSRSSKILYFWNVDHFWGQYFLWLIEIKCKYCKTVRSNNH